MATRAQREAAAATITPRLLSRLQAAVYVGLSPTEWDKWWKLHKLKSLPHGRLVRWDRFAIDRVIDRLMEALDSDEHCSDDAYAAERMAV
jgi:hypothetical protein